MTLDIVIVGGGPAGAWAGYRLARAGARVAILDGSHPREKPCGGGVTGRAVELIREAFPAGLSGVCVESASFEHRDRRATVALRPDRDGPPPLTIVSRREFDGALLDAAERAGAAVIRERAVSIERRGPGWRIATRTATLDGGHLVGADGPASLVRRSVAAAFPRAELSIASGYFVPGATDQSIAVAFEDEPAGYLWSFPRQDHLAVGVCAQAETSSSAQLLLSARRWIAGHVPSAAALTRYSWPIPSLSVTALERERYAGDRWLLLGDAAGLVDPITREGIYFALRSADLAAAAMLAGRSAPREYAAAVRDEIGSELLRAARIRARFYRPQFMALLLAALDRSSRIRAVMADLVAGRQTYHGLRRRLLATMELRLMYHLLHGSHG